MLVPEEQAQETTIRLEVPPGYAEGERVDVYVTAMLANATRAKVQRGIREGRVEINGRRVKPSHRVQPGETIVCRLLRPPPIEAKPEAIPLDIRFEDAYLIVLDKQPGLVVHPAYGNRTGTLVNALLHHVGAGRVTGRTDGLVTQSGEIGLSTSSAHPRYEGDPTIRPGLVHRLDKDTSGLMVVAKNDVVHTHLAQQFYHRTIHRSYLALVWGHPNPPEGRIEARLGRDPRDRKKVAVVDAPAGKHAITNYAVRSYLWGATLVEFRLETGRTHQIRIHALHMGHPIIGDPAYGVHRVPGAGSDPHILAAHRSARACLHRQALHAASLGFTHPVTGASLDFHSDPPEDFRHALGYLRTDDA